MLSWIPGFIISYPNTLYKMQEYKQINEIYIVEILIKQNYISIG